MIDLHLKILHLEDVATDAELVERELKKSGIRYHSMVVSNRTDFVNALSSFKPDVVLSDHSLPSFNSHEALMIVKQSGLKIPFVLVTATISEEYAVEIMREGANDYVLKDRMQRLPNAVKSVIEKNRMEKEQQKFLEEIIANEALLSEAEHLAGFGSWQADLEKGTSKWSNESYRILGYKPGEIQPTLENFLQQIHPDDREYFTKKLEENINRVSNESMNAAEINFRVIDKSGQVKHMRSEFVTERDKEKRVIRVTGINQDISKLIHSENELKRHLVKLEAAGETMSAILNALPANIALLNKEGVIVSVNDSWKEFSRHHELGEQAFEVGENYVALMSGAASEASSYRKQIADGIKTVIDQKSLRFSLEYPCHTPEKKQWFQVTVTPLSSTESKGVVVMHMDITDRWLNVIEKERIAKDLIQRNNELEQFTYIISHNLRAPLANIIGITDMMNTFSLTVKEEDEMRTELISSVKKLDMIIRDLNSILQTKQELTDRKELVSFREICDDINLSIRNLIKKQKVTIRTNFSDKENMISVKSYLYSIFYNLILNSIKYRQMELDPVIKIRSAVNEGKLSLIFEDNGIGIDLETQGEHMFGMYKRFHTHQEGKGLGLFMVKSQVESLGGKIFVESEVNIGTKFIVEFDLYHS